MTFNWQLAFQQGHSYAGFLQHHGDAGDRRNWAEMHARIRLTSPQRQLLQGFVRELNVLCMAGAWCGDCVQQCPIFDHFAGASQHVKVRLVDRDAGPWNRELTINGAPRVPQVVFLSEDFQLVGRTGERTLSKYRQLGRDQLGPSCPTGIGAPPAELTAAVVQDWLDEFERIHWILRLSPRLRERHGD